MSQRINDKQLAELIEAAIFVANKPISIEHLKNTVLAEFLLTTKRIKQSISQLQLDYQDRGVQLVEVGSGYRFQACASLSPWLNKLWQEKAPKYSRAFLETLALIAYRQPITRGEIEQVRGVAVSSQIIKTMLEQDWIKVVGHKEVPGRPALYATTKQFLDYFSLSSLAQLPELPNISEKIEHLLAVEQQEVN